jgi:hypothetical protein
MGSEVRAADLWLKIRPVCRVAQKSRLPDSGSQEAKWSLK